MIGCGPTNRYISKVSIAIWGHMLLSILLLLLNPCLARCRQIIAKLLFLLDVTETIGLSASGLGVIHLRCNAKQSEQTARDALDRLGLLVSTLSLWILLSRNGTLYCRLFSYAKALTLLSCFQVFNNYLWLLLNLHFWILRCLLGCQVELSREVRACNGARASTEHLEVVQLKVLKGLLKE